MEGPAGPDGSPFPRPVPGPRKFSRRLSAGVPEPSHSRGRTTARVGSTPGSEVPRTEVGAGMRRSGCPNSLRASATRPRKATPSRTEITTESPGTDPTSTSPGERGPTTSDPGTCGTQLARDVRGGAEVSGSREQLGKRQSRPFVILTRELLLSPYRLRSARVWPMNPSDKSALLAAGKRWGLITLVAYAILSLG